MLFGNFALLISAGLVAQRTAPVVMDIVLFIVAAGLILVRYIDITRFKGETSEGTPATLAVWRRYAVVVAAIAGGLWALARVVAAQGWM